jgi:hypothetical protein
LQDPTIVLTRTQQNTNVAGVEVGEGAVRREQTVPLGREEAIALGEALDNVIGEVLGRGYLAIEPRTVRPCCLVHVLELQLHRFAIDPATNSAKSPPGRIL